MVKQVRLGAKYQIVIPREFRDAHGWTSGQELLLTSTPAGVALVPKLDLHDLVGMLPEAAPFDQRDKDDRTLG